VKKLISIGVALALLTMVVVPIGVAAEDYPDDPGAYSKTPFGILGTGIELIGDLVANVPYVNDMLIEYVDVSVVTGLIGPYAGENLAWMTDMTAWSMVAVGDVVKTALGLPVIADALPVELAGVEDIFYVLGSRLWDPWGAYVGTPATVLPDVVIDNYPPTLPTP